MSIFTGALNKMQSDSGGILSYKLVKKINLDSSKCKAPLLNALPDFSLTPHPESRAQPRGYVCIN